MDSKQATKSMEAVHSFTNELFSLYDFKIPISKAKMGAITKSALKAIKFYKHVVQNVEKFIFKCKPEYKIPALYVIDAIVRQSRHQFGPEKDVYAPRFARNMEETFAHLFRCSQEDKSKIIRVLNLWQKNNVFAPEVVSPLFDLANPDHPVHQNYNLQQQQNQAQNDISNGDSPKKDDNQNAEMLSASNLQKFQYQQLMMQQQGDCGTSGVTLESMKFNKQLLEFDYGSDGDDDKVDAVQFQAGSSNTLQYHQFSKVLEDPNIIKQLQSIKNIDVQRYLNEMPSSSNSMETNNAAPMISLANINTLRGPQTINLIDQERKDQDVEFIGGDSMMLEVIPISSRSPTPTPKKRRRSRSYSRDRYRRRRSRSRSRSTRSRSPRNRRRSSRDRKEREKQREIEKERRRKGLPEIKRDHLSVCSTTLWVGHLSKLVQQEELSDTFGKYGDILSIDMIPPRGCAYIVMNRRQDANKAMQYLKNHKFHNRTITISWAAGKGVKGKEWKDYFDQTLGVTYIPHVKLTQQTDFEALEEGGMYDEDTMPAWIKEKIKQPVQPTIVNKDGLIMPPFYGIPSDVTAIDTSQPPPQAILPATLPAFPLGARLLMPNVHLPLGVPPPNMLGMVFNPTGADKNAVLQPGLMGFPPALSVQQQQTSGDDMDIEQMEEDHHNIASTSKDSQGLLQQQQAAFFHQPPPQLGMASLLMQQEDLQKSERNQTSRNQGQGFESDRNDFQRRRGDNYNNRNNARWPHNNDSNIRDNRRERTDNGRSREGGFGNNLNRRYHYDGDFDKNGQDFNSSNRQGGFSQRSFNQRGSGNKGNFSSRGAQNFGNRSSRDGNRGFNNFNEMPHRSRQGFYDREARGNRVGRNRDSSTSNEDRHQNFRNNHKESKSDQPEESQTLKEDAPPGVDDFEPHQETNFPNNAQTETFKSENDSSVNEASSVEISGTTPLCDENETKE